MEIKKSTSNRNLIIIVSAIVVVALAGYTSYAYLSHLWPFETQSNATPDTNTKPADTPPTASDNNSDNATSVTPGATDNPQDKTPQQYDDTSSNDDSSNSSDTAKNNITGTVNFASVANSKLTIRVTIDQHLTSGSCTLTLTNSATGKTYTASADIVDNPSSATCQGFDVPTNKLSSGDWNINIGVTSNDNEGTITGQVKI